MRRARLAAAAALLAFAFVLVPTGQASAAVAPSLPDPVNVLPSTIKGSFVPRAGQGMEALYAMMYRSVVTPKQATAAVAVKAGTATVTEAQLVASYAQKFKGFPATKAAGLLKVAGPIGAAVAQFDMGLMLGNGIVTAQGWDDKGALCSTGNDAVEGWLSLVNGVDCAGFRAASQQFIDQANQDAPTGITGPRICSTYSGIEYCMQLVKTARHTTSNQVNDILCFTTTKGGAPEQFTSARWQYKTSASTNWIAPSNVISTTAPWAWQLQDGAPPANFDPANLGGSSGSQYACGTAFTSMGSLRTAGTRATTTPVLQYRFDNATATPATVVPVTGDPERRLECRVKLSDGTSRVKQSAPFKESTGIIPDVVCPDTFPPELDVVETSIWEVGGGKEHMLSTQTTTPEFDVVRETMADCLDGSCILDLVSSTTGSCNANPAPCADWFTDPNKTSKYSCTFGTHAVDLAQCNTLAPYYKPGAKHTASPLGDPTTGQPIPNPGVKAGTTTKPDVNTGGCASSGWGDPNPIEWVLSPVRCAIYEAFVPSVGKVEVVQATVEQKFEVTPPGKIAAAVTALNLGSAPSGCDGLSFDLSWIEENGIPLPGAPGAAQMLNACPGDVLHPWAVFVSVLLTGGVLFILIKTVPRLIGRIFGYGGVGG